MHGEETIECLRINHVAIRESQLQTDNGGHQPGNDEKKQRRNDVHQSQTFVVDSGDPLIQVS